MAVLVRHLPLDSAVAIAEGGIEARWQLEHHLLASIFDQLAVLDWHLVIANMDPGAQRPPRPKRLERPGVTSDVETNHFGNTEHLDMAQVRAYLDSFKPPEE